MSRLSTAIAELRENERQAEAFSVQGHCAVLAPPGSGKTKLLTARMAFDLASESIPAPQGAACITMTNAAAGELRRRLRILGCPPRANIFVGTVHAFALSQIIGPYARAAGLIDLADARLASDQEEQAAFDRAFIAQVGADADPKFLKPTMGKMRRLGDYSGTHELGGQDVADLARAYEHELEAAGVYDFDDLMRHSVEMVEEHEWIRRALVSTYPHLYIDEYQDLPPTLDRLVRGLVFDEAVDASLFAVGDPDQAIFGFIGTRPQLLPELAEMPTVTKVELEVNYRCADDIVTASLRALGQSRRIHGYVEGGELVFESPSRDEMAQRLKAVEVVRVAIEEGVAPDQITVLSKAGHERDRLADALRTAEIPVFSRDDRYYRPTPLTMAIERLALYAATEPRPVQDLGEVLDEWQAATRTRQDFGAAAGIVSLLAETESSWSAGVFVDALAPLGLEPLLEDPGRSEDGRQLERMRTALSADGALAGMTVGELGRRARANGHVMSSTIHGVKGLEFEVVVICGCEDGKFPDFRAKDAAALAEEQRKFYVSVTRAKRRVHFLHSATTVTAGGRVIRNRPSPFLELMK